MMKIKSFRGYRIAAGEVAHSPARSSSRQLLNILKGNLFESPPFQTAKGLFNKENRLFLHPRKSFITIRYKVSHYFRFFFSPDDLRAVKTREAGQSSCRMEPAAKRTTIEPLAGAAFLRAWLGIFKFNSKGRLNEHEGGRCVRVCSIVVTLAFTVIKVQEVW